MIDIYLVAQELGLESKYKDKVYINSDGTQAFFKCPFPHTNSKGEVYFESVPSFTINLTSGKFFCFSCGEKGTSIEELYRKLGKKLSNKIESDISFEIRESVLEMYNTFLSSMSNKDYNLIQEFLESRGIKSDRGFIDFFGLSICNIDDNYFFVICHNNENYDQDFYYFTGRKFKIENDNFILDVKPKYYNVRYKAASPKTLYNVENLKYLSGNEIFLVESIMDSLKLNSMRIKNLCTLGASLNNFLKNFLLSYQSFNNKYILIPQNDSAGENWEKMIVDFFGENSISYRVSRIDKKYKDICDIPTNNELNNILGKI
jgi:hypothetical protein